MGQEQPLEVISSCNGQSSRDLDNYILRRLLAANEVFSVDVEFIITPPTTETMSDLFDRILGQTFANATSSLGLRMNATYSNSTTRLVRRSVGKRAPNMTGVIVVGSFRQLHALCSPVCMCCKLCCLVCCQPSTRCD